MVDPSTDEEGTHGATWSVGELHDALNGVFLAVFGDEVWVEGELANVSRSNKGHVYFDLVDPAREDSPPDPTAARLAVTLFSTERQAVNRHLRDSGGSVRMVDGVRVRVRGRLQVYAARSTVQLRMSWIDPAYTLGVIGLERDRVLAALTAEGLLGANAAIHAPAVPLGVALVTSRGSAACADALRQFEASTLGFRVTVVDARTQGVDAPGSVAAALDVAARLPVDVVLVVRGGGARTDLAAFDSEVIARAIAACPHPVVTGIGHETDRTVADEVAHSAHPTPTAAAASLVSRVRTVLSELDAVAALITASARGRLLRASAAVDRTASRAGRGAQRHLDRDRRRVERIGHRAATAAPRSLQRARERLDDRSGRIAEPARRRLRRRAADLDALAARARAHDPATALARGWSITRDADGGVLRSAGGLAAGTSLHTQLHDGTVRSVVVDESGTDPGGPEHQETT